jgi:hypothetical protein
MLRQAFIRGRSRLVRPLQRDDLAVERCGLPLQHDDLGSQHGLLSPVRALRVGLGLEEQGPERRVCVYVCVCCCLRCLRCGAGHAPAVLNTVEYC